MGRDTQINQRRANLTKKLCKVEPGWGPARHQIFLWKLAFIQSSAFSQGMKQHNEIVFLDNKIVLQTNRPAEPPMELMLVANILNLLTTI